MEGKYDLAAEHYFQAGSAAITRDEHAVALRSLVALEKLPDQNSRILAKIKSLRALISYNR